RAWDGAGGAVELTCRYLEAFATHACYDCWEEGGDRVHTSTLACAYGGLVAAARATGRVEARGTAEAIRSTVLERGVRDGVVRKSLGVDAVDASALWLSHPFGLLEPGGSAVASTVAEIEGRLRRIDGVGVRRYEADTYYGGGSWPILTAWLGWHYAVTGRSAKAGTCLEWIEEQASGEGDLPEQVGGEGRDRVMYEEWVGRWGMPAQQLLWSHAMYLVLCGSLGTGMDQWQVNQTSNDEGGHN
ncbi:MAG: glycoside hydrolase family 15 protein, partial [Acidimicrobiales bacterium]